MMTVMTSHVKEAGSLKSMVDCKYVSRPGVRMRIVFNSIRLKTKTRLVKGGNILPY